jgi:hypothetical protein
MGGPLALLLSLLSGSPALATNSPIELRTTLATLMERLPGRFDNAAQLFFDQETKTPPAEQHGRVFRSFLRVDAPAIGANVLVAQVRYGGDAGRFDDAEFQVWTLAVDAEHKAVRMAPRRFRDPGPYRDRALDAAAFKGLTPADLLPAEGSAGCDLYWRKYGEDLRAVTAPGECRRRSMSLQKDIDWSWEYILSGTELWVSFAGRDERGRIVAGRADQVHWRLGKAREFECLLGYRPPDGSAPQVNNGPHIHDRGGVLTWTTRAPAVRTFQYELLRGMWPSNSGRNYEDLLRVSLYEVDPRDPKTRQLLGVGWASAASDRASMSNGIYNVRCKLFDPSAPPPRNE